MHDYEAESVRPVGRPKKTYSEVVAKRRNDQTSEMLWKIVNGGN